MNYTGVKRTATPGSQDAVVKPAIVDQHQTGMTHAQLHIMANAGHVAFWDDAAHFNQRLRAFRESA
jgi:pimeloyl-ACP methyl ester carboxylesterase